MGNVVIPTIFFLKGPRCWEKPKMVITPHLGIFIIEFYNNIPYNTRSPKKKILREVWFFGAKKVTTLPHLMLPYSEKKGSPDGFLKPKQSMVFCKKRL